MDEQAYMREYEVTRQNAKAAEEAQKAFPSETGEISKINVNILKYILGKEAPPEKTVRPESGHTSQVEPADGEDSAPSAGNSIPSVSDDYASRPGVQPSVKNAPMADLDAQDLPSPMGRTEQSDGDPVVIRHADSAMVLEEVKPAKAVGDRTVVQRNVLPWAEIAGALMACQRMAPSSNSASGGTSGTGDDPRRQMPRQSRPSVPSEGKEGLAASQGGKSKIFRFHPDLARLESELKESNERPSAGSVPPKARPAVSTILLAVERAGSYSRVVNNHFKRAQWRVQVGEGVDKSLQIVSPEKISLVIVDSKIKGFFELLQELKVNKSTNHIPIIAVSRADLKLSTQQELQVLPDEELVEPFEMGSLLRYADWELARAAKSGVIFDQRVHLTLPTRLEKLEDAKRVMERLLRQSGMEKDDQTTLLAAIREAMTNAARHGNKNRPATAIEVLYLLDRGKVTIAVKDEGDGFDIRRYCDRNGAVRRVDLLKERLQDEDISELGITLLAQSADIVHYNEAGNMVTLIKYLKGRKGNIAPRRPARTPLA
jgi:serine/threonine-protein kinase RsbW